MIQLQVCQPLMRDGTDCSHPSNHLRYIEDFTCLNGNSTDRMLKEMRLSFPSGHSSFASYTMIYLSVSILFKKKKICDWLNNHFYMSKTSNNHAHTYTQIYLHKRMTWNGSKLLKHFLQFYLFVLAWYTAMSRISNYKHHWSDVLAGASIGSLCAIIVVILS